MIPAIYALFFLSLYQIHYEASNGVCFYTASGANLGQDCAQSTCAYGYSYVGKFYGYCTPTTGSGPNINSTCTRCAAGCAWACCVLLDLQKPDLLIAVTLTYRTGSSPICTKTQPYPTTSQGWSCNNATDTLIGHTWSGGYKVRWRALGACLWPLPAHHQLLPSLCSACRLHSPPPVILAT